MAVPPGVVSEKTAGRMFPVKFFLPEKTGIRPGKQNKRKKEEKYLTVHGIHPGYRAIMQLVSS